MTAASKSTNKRACNNALFRIKERAGDTVVLCVLLSGVLLFILWPMLCIALRSFRAADGGFTLEAYGNVLAKYGTSMRNSVVVGICTAVCTTILSLSAALTCATRRSWGRTLCMILLTAAMVAPPFVSSLAYIQLYGRRGWITYRLLGLSWNPYNLAGVVAMQSLSFTPLNALFLLGVLDKLDADSLRSARDLGAKPSAILRDIVLPLMRLGLLVSMLLSFVRSLADYGTPVIIGGRSVTLAAEVYLQVIGYSNLEKSSAMNMFLLVPSILFFFYISRAYAPVGQADGRQPQRAGRAFASAHPRRFGRLAGAYRQRTVLRAYAAAIWLRFAFRLPKEQEGRIFIHA